MQKHLISHQQTGYFSSLILAYLQQYENLRTFQAYNFNIDNFAQVIDNLKDSTFDRKLLFNVFDQQYSDISTSQKVLDNIKRLQKDTTFAVVTGHQTNLFTGHLYFFYKIISSINLAERLKTKYPQYDFVPVYWMGSEDHDFAEINHVHLFGKTLTWNLPKSDTKGATGRLSAATLKSLIEEELDPILGDSPKAQALLMLLKTAYLNESNTLAKATQVLVNQLFKDYGLLVLDQDDALLKQPFIPIMEKELLATNSLQIVEKTNEKLEQNGYHAQAYTREINLFYLTESDRKYIQKNENSDTYTVADSDISFSKSEILTHLRDFPERFSPNVILRPIYQQVVLPSVAYVGGGGELAYWFQLKGLFEHYNANYPILVLRNSALWVDKSGAKKMKQLGFTIDDLFLAKDILKALYVRKNTENQLDLMSEKADLQVIIKQIESKALNIDKTLEGTVKAEMRKILKSIENLETKILRAEKRKFDTAIQQIEGLKNKLFPKGTLQERHDNFIPFYLKYGDDFVATLKANLDAFEKQFTILIDN